MKTAYNKMASIELEKELLQLQDKLDDIELLRSSVLGQTGNHVSSGYVNKFDQEIQDITDAIAAVENALAKHRM